MVLILPPGNWIPVYTHFFAAEHNDFLLTEIPRPCPPRRAVIANGGRDGAPCKKNSRKIFRRQKVVLRSELLSITRHCLTPVSRVLFSLVLVATSLDDALLQWSFVPVALGRRRENRRFFLLSEKRDIAIRGCPIVVECT